MSLFTRLSIALVMFIPAACFSQVAAVNGTKRILVLCTGNSARSQMTQGFLKSFNPALEVYSAGTAPSPRINPFAVQVMKELEIDISSGTPKNVKQFLGKSFDYVVTVCDDADKSCPTFRGKVGKRLHIGFPDPAKAVGTDAEKLVVFRRVRDDIRKRFKELYENERLGAIVSSKNSRLN